MFKKMFLIPALMSASLLLTVEVASASSPGEVTTANSEVTFNRKDIYPRINTYNEFYEATSEIASQGYYNAEGNAVHPVAYNFKKKENDSYRLKNVMTFIDTPSYSINYWGGTPIASGAYVWNENVRSWVLPNPLSTTTGDIDTSSGVKLHSVGDSIDYRPLSYLLNNELLSGERQVAIIKDIESMPVNEVSRTTYNIIQERAHPDRGYWYSFRYYLRAMVEYEFDGTLTGTNPYDQVDVLEDQSVVFNSTIAIESPTNASADLIWQVSTDGGNTYTDIEGTSTNTGGLKNIDKTYEFTPTISDNDNLYRVKIMPKEVENATPIYTEAAALKFDASLLAGGDIKIQYQDTEQNMIAPTIIKSGNIGEEYFSEQLPIEGYTFTEVQGESSGNFTSEEQIVTYVYKKNPILGKDVTVHYQDTKGTEIAPTSTKSGNIGEEYTSDQLDINGYTFKEIEGNRTGQFTDEAQTVIYIYQKNIVPGKNVTIKYQDRNGNTLAPTIIKSGNIGEKYTSDQLDIDGYTFKEIDGSATGMFTEEVQTVIYVYTNNTKKSPITSNKKESSKSKGKGNNTTSNPNAKESALPKTGESNSSMFVKGGMIILVAGIGYVLIFKNKTRV